MNRATPHSVESSPPAPVTCAADGGCSYLRALSTIERLAGFDQTARTYAKAASRCRRFGCWAAQRDAESAKQVPNQVEPVPLDAVRPGRDTRSSRAAGAAAPIPFIRAAMVDMVSDGHGNYVERRPMKLETLPGLGDPLGYLYQYWCGLRAETECGLANIDTVHLTRAGIMGGLHVVDVSSSDPQDFRFELFGYAIPMKRPEKPRAHPIAIYADCTLRDYNTVRMTAAPRLHRLRCRLGDVAHHYTRLILPFLDAEGHVSHLLVAIRQEIGNGTKIETRN